MPTVVTNYSYGQLDGTYILPPILYPDGKYYLKLGHHDKFEENLTTSEAIKDWYEQSDYLKWVKTMFSYRICIVCLWGGHPIWKNMYSIDFSFFSWNLELYYVRSS